MPVNGEGKRVVEQIVKGKGRKDVKLGEFKFFCDSWKKTEGETPFRHGATSDNVFPDEQKGKSCCSTLLRLSCAAEQMEEADRLAVFVPIAIAHPQHPHHGH